MPLMFTAPATMFRYFDYADARCLLMLMIAAPLDAAACCRFSRFFAYSPLRRFDAAAFFRFSVLPL